MSKRFWAMAATMCASVAFAATWALWVPAVEPPVAKESPSKDVFGLTKIYQFHLEVPAKEWETMQPAGGIRFPGGPMPPAKPADKPGDKPTDVHKGGSFGLEFPFAHAAFTAEGKTYKEVGLRYKGGGSYVTSVGKLKRNFKVELDHFGEEQLFHGQKKINLN